MVHSSHEIKRCLLLGRKAMTNINKVDDLKKIGKFLERYNLLQLNHEETKSLNRPVTSMEIESVIKNGST